MAVIIALVLIGPVPQTKTDRIAGVSWNSVKEGISFIVNKPIMLSTMLLDFVATFFASANTLMPIIARDVLHVGVVEYGWLSASPSVGAVLAALVVSQLPEIRKQGQIFLGSVVIFGIATVIFGVARVAGPGVVRFGCHRSRGFRQYDYPQHHPPIADARSHPRADDQRQSNFFSGRSTTRGGGSRSGGAVIWRADCNY